MNFVQLAKWLKKLPRLNLATCTLALLGAVLAGFAIAASCAYQIHGIDGVAAAATAAAVCWAAAMLALVTSALVRGQFAGLQAMLLGMLFRIGLPLTAGMYLSRRGGALAEAGVFGLIVVFYLLMLAVETPLSLSLLGLAHRDSKSR
jgi:hypothetical protein